MKSAVIGAGVIGTLHAAILKKSGRLCSVCDIDEAKLTPYPDVPVYTDFIRLFDEEKPDTVHICTPHYLHADMICEALCRDINVLCEKPLCIRKEDIGRILDAEKKSKATLGVCLQNRYNPENRFVKDYLKGKNVRQITGVVTWHRDEKYYASADWRGKKATEGGGVLINQALHTLDLALWLSDIPDTVVSSLSDLTLGSVIEVEDTAVIIGRGKTALNFFATNGSGCDMPVELTVKTDNEIIKITPGAVMINGEARKFESVYKALGKQCYGSGHEALIEDFYACIEDGRPFEINAEEASSVVRVILAAYESGGYPVKI